MSEVSRVTTKLIGSIIEELAEHYKEKDGCQVKLTQELADHLINMYNNTDWNQFEDYCDIDIPEEIFTGEVDSDELYKHIGEYVHLSIYGDPWPGVFEATSFINGVTLDFYDHGMQMSLATMYDQFKSNYQIDFISELTKSVGLMLESGMTEKDIEKSFKKMKKEFYD